LPPFLFLLLQFRKRVTLRRGHRQFALGHDLLAELVALLVDRGDHRPHRHTQIDQHGFGKLKRAFECFGHGVAGPDAIELRGMVRIAGAHDDRQVGRERAQLAHDAQREHGLVHGHDDGAGLFEVEPVDHRRAVDIAEQHRQARGPRPADHGGLRSMAR
jgi:hypothetical protein